jgi:hypothetical protein
MVDGRGSDLAVILGADPDRKAPQKLHKGQSSYSLTQAFRFHESRPFGSVIEPLDLAILTRHFKRYLAKGYPYGTLRASIDTFYARYPGKGPRFFVSTVVQEKLLQGEWNDEQ